MDIQDTRRWAHSIMRPFLGLGFEIFQPNIFIYAPPVNNTDIQYIEPVSLGIMGDIKERLEEIYELKSLINKHMGIPISRLGLPELRRDRLLSFNKMSYYRSVRNRITIKRSVFKK